VGGGDVTGLPEAIVRRVRAVLIVAVIAVASVGVGCGRDAEPSTSPTSDSSLPSSGSPSSPGASSRAGWFGVVAIAEDPNDLDRETEELVPTLGSGVVVAPADCFDGLPATIATGYVLGVFGDSRADVDRALERADRLPRFVGRVRMVCLD
jgi:hypothetical protein